MIVGIGKLLELWKYSLIQYNYKLLNKYPFTKETKEFLRLVGLPTNCDLLKDLNISFYKDFTMISIQNFKYVVIGDDYGSKYCIGEKKDELISISIDVEGVMQTRFVNSCIKNFLAFLQIFLTERPKLSKANDEEALELVNTIRGNFIEIDPIAMNDEDNWWSVILEQTEQGLL